MTSLFGIWVLLKKEVKDYFLSPFAYILSGLFSVIIGWLFFNYLVSSKHLTTLSLSSSILKPIFGNINFIFLFLSPLLTMKLFAEEKKQHTIELLFKSNLSNAQIIIGKFIANMVVVLFMLALTLIFPLILSFSGYSDWGTVFSGYLGLIFSIMCYSAVGIFTSSLTENQIIAAISSFCILLGSMLMVMSINATNNIILGQIVQFCSVAFHYEGFVRGAITNYNLAFYLSFISFFFYLTHKSLESRNW